MGENGLVFLQDLMASIKEVYPYLEREQFSLYCRYGGSELYPIFDHMTMVTAFALMDAHESPLLYLIRKGESMIASNLVLRLVLFPQPSLMGAVRYK